MTTNDFRVGERMRHRGGVSHHYSQLLTDDFGKVITRLPGSVVSVNPRSSVLVQSIAVSSRYVHPLAEQPAKSGRVVHIDLRGLGATPGPKRDVSIPLNTGVLCALLQRAGVGNPVLAWHSIGTPVVTQLASDSPEIIDRRVLIAPTVISPNRVERTVATALVRGISMDFMRSHLMLATNYLATNILATGYLARCGIPCFFNEPA